MDFQWTDLKNAKKFHLPWLLRKAVGRKYYTDTEEKKRHTNFLPATKRRSKAFEGEHTHTHTFLLYNKQLESAKKKTSTKTLKLQSTADKTQTRLQTQKKKKKKWRVVYIWEKMCVFWKVPQRFKVPFLSLLRTHMHCVLSERVQQSLETSCTTKSGQSICVGCLSTFQLRCGTENHRLYIVTCSPHSVPLTLELWRIRSADCANHRAAITIPIKLSPITKHRQQQQWQWRW